MGHKSDSKKKDLNASKLSLRMNVFLLQDILERFELFPIKCRIQRALEIFQIAKERKAKLKVGLEKPLKTKVRFYLCS
jgi:hypothetical protein